MSSLLSTHSSNLIEDFYQAWLRDNQAVGPEWDALFRGMDSEPADRSDRRSATVDMTYKQSRLDALLWAYRDVGYFYAKLNPLAVDVVEQQNFLYPQAKSAYEQLTLENFGLSKEDMDTVFWGGKNMNPRRGALAEIVTALEETYCGSVGAEFLHIQNKPVRRWLINRMESTRNKAALSSAERQIILTDLIRAEEFEHFLHTTFIGQKRFSLEGAEVVVPGLHFLVDQAHAHGVKEYVIGMTHRGRLTVLNQVLNKPPEEIFTEFEDNFDPGSYGGSGDVKYHLGFSTDHINDDGTSVHISLVSNPSHLESVDPVVEGKARGTQDKGHFIRTMKQIVPIIFHGDAAFAGQGIVGEVFNLSQVRGYETGGTIHIIINNQIGFTTSTKNSRSTFFPTDVAKMMLCPIFHVNGDDPEAVIHVLNLALEFRQKFGEDVVVDIFCFRRHGHNEGDEPSFTNPKMYKIIKKHPGLAALHGRSLAQDGVFSQEDQDALRRSYRDELRNALKTARSHPPEPTIKPFQGPDWTGLKGGYSSRMVKTGVDKKVLLGIAETLTTVPPGFSIHPKLKRIVDGKAERLRETGEMDWAFAESLAFGSLVLEGVPIRMSGQDVERGTFSQRHLTWWDIEADEPQPYTPLSFVGSDQASFRVYNSPLSEYSILGFDYGFSLARPDVLTIWEAQFGDFVNGAQVIIDNFIVAAEKKWQRYSGLVMLLPHGFEGQGPEHSSAHMERFLQLCADENIQVCNVTTPAQYFHLLRRQMKREFRNPLIVMTPKSLLRHPMAVSRLKDLAEGHFIEVLADPDLSPDGKDKSKRFTKLVFCSGKLFYDLLSRRRELKANVGIIRMEQLYPFPEKRVREILKQYPTEQVLWVQEEPENRGACTFVQRHFARHFPELELKSISRAESSSPATGSHKQHLAEQECILNGVFGQSSGG